MKRAVIVVVVVTVAVLGAVYLWGPSSAPQGQAPLVKLSNENFSEFQSTFDADPSVPRLVLLLSPT